MIIENKKDHVMTIPYKGVYGQSSNMMEGEVILLPGCNDVPIEVWKKARRSVKGDIAKKLIIECEVKLKEDTIKVGEEKINVDIISEVKEFVKLPATQAEEVVLKTFNLKTLKKWKKKESRDAVRSAIVNQIESVEKYGDKKQKKDED